MRSLQPSRLIWIRAGVAVLATFAALACRPAVSAASQEVIESPGSPLSQIYVDEDLACQVQATGDTDASFFGGTEPGGCGTFLALTGGEDVNTGEGLHLFGPSPAAADAPVEADFEAIKQEITGSGTEAKPFLVTTRVGAYEPVDGGEGKVEVAEVAEEDSYVTGQDLYTTKLTIKYTRKDTGEALKGTLYHIGDCYLADQDVGYGAVNVPSTGSVACTITPEDIPPARYMAYTPLATSGFPVSSAHYVESHWPTFWEDVKPDGEQLPDEDDATTSEDNGMGLSWPIELAEGGKATLSFTTTVTPSSAPTSSTSAGPCVPDGQLPVTVSAVNGAAAVDYVVDGGPVEAAEVDEAGQATIPSTPMSAGLHTLEYWGEDKSGVQEGTHHVLDVTVASGGPSLAITSDQGRSSYERSEPASVTIIASGPGLTSNPSAAHVPISTETPGTFSITRSAADACGRTEASFTYTVAGAGVLGEHAAKATLATLSPPVLGKTVNVETVSGTVLVALAPTAQASAAGGLDASLAAPLQAVADSLSKGLHFIPLTEARQIPVGSVLQTTAGVARIEAATAASNKPQFGNFGAGIFQLLQSRRQKGLTELDIEDERGPGQACATLGKRAAVAAKLSSKVLARLTGSAHGKFTIQGQYSAATVRGTVWSVLNQCDGTLTRVTRGVVSVRDFVTRKTITLFTGQHYLAEAP